MSRKITPSARKAQAIAQLLDGQSDAHSGEELLSALIRLSTEWVLQETLEQEQTETLGRGRYERQATPQGYRNGYAVGTVKTAEGVLRLQLPQVRGPPGTVSLQAVGGPGLHQRCADHVDRRDVCGWDVPTCHRKRSGEGARPVCPLQEGRQRHHGSPAPRV